MATARWVLDRPRVAGVIVGARTAEHTRSNLKVFEVAASLVIQVVASDGGRKTRETKLSSPDGGRKRPGREVSAPDGGGKPSFARFPLLTAISRADSKATVS